MTTKPHILICDDQPMIHEMLGAYLTEEGFDYTSAYDGEESLTLAEQLQPDLIVLDIMMPKRTGTDVCRELRTKMNCSVPIIMLTAKSEEIDKILCLELGADDYIVKPFSPREVVARIKAVLRRYNEQDTSAAATIRRPDLEININNYDVKINGKTVRFTPKEVEILHLLAGSPGKVFTREAILSQVWGFYYGDERAVDTQIKRIRQKIPDECTSWQIKTVYGIGYKFEVVG